MGYVSLASTLIITILGMVRFKKLTMPFKILIVWLAIDFLLDASNSWIISKYKNNARLSNVLCIGEYIFYVVIYYYLFRSKIIRRFILVSIGLFLVFFFINALFLQPFTSVFPTNAIMTAEILYVLLAILLFKQMLQYPLQVNIMKQSVFWFNTAILFFSTTMFLNLSLMNYYRKYHPENISLIVIFWYSIDIIFNILLGIGILNNKKEELTANV
ncbi:MAG: hypothetical protein JO080_08115 [Mucilaginibacter sp.]|nr:hypothetical protein [Mucilaginibacter sp.]